MYTVHIIAMHKMFYMTLGVRVWKSLLVGLQDQQFMKDLSAQSDPTEDLWCLRYLRAMGSALR